MKICLDWLCDYLDAPIDRDDAERILTEQGFPLDGEEQLTLSTGRAAVQLDFEVTSNRSDCLSHVGLAREIAAGAGRTLKAPSCELPAATGPAVTDLTSVENHATDGCPVYTARVIRGVTIKPSPTWLAESLEAVGLRPVNNVVDITNFVLLELGQPLHAFDMGKLAEERIVVRRATKDEPFTAIDGTKHKLAPDMLVIADATRPVAVAGVMGGLDSEVGDATTDILLESARFDPLSIRRTSRALKLSSDSSYRFERGVDPVGVELASRRAAALILELAGGELAEGVIRVGEDEPAPRPVTMRIARCRQLLGIDLDTDTIVGHLANLGLAPEADGDDAITCTIPTFRLDLEREVDLIEEVARCHGLANVPVTEKIHIVARPPQPAVKTRQRMTGVLVARGYHETVTPSLLAEKAGRPFLPKGAAPAMVADDRRKAEPMLRPSVLASLLLCRKANQDAGNDDVKLYELASVWHEQGGRIVEHRELAMLRDAEQPEAALRELRGTLDELAEAFGRELAVKPVEHPLFDAAAEVTLSRKRLGVMGRVSPKVVEVFDLQTPVMAALLDGDLLLGLERPVVSVGHLPRYPGIERDLSIVVDEAVTWDHVEQVVRQTKPALMESLSFVDVYRGKPIDKRKKSVSLRMVFRDPSGTLRHEQVDPQVEAVVGALQQAVGAELRA